MSLQLAKNETILKKYNYSLQKSKSGSLENNLIITDKRIISESVSEKSVLRKEMPVAAADYIGSTYAANNATLIIGLAILVLGITLIIVGAVSEMVAGIIIGIIAIVAGVVVLVLALLKRGAAVTLQISGKMGEHNLMSVGASTLSSRKKINSVKIKVNKEESLKMIDEIGALLIGIKEGTYKH